MVKMFEQATQLISTFDFFIKIVKIEFKNKHHMCLFLYDVMFAQKTKYLILFTSQINIESSKASHIDIDLFYKKRNSTNFWKFCWCTCGCPDN
jgi:hypothetical protein